MDISGIEYLGLDCVLKRGSGEIIVETDDALFIRDHIRGACFLACENTSIGIPLLERYMEKDCNLMMVSNYSLGNAVFERFGFAEMHPCFQAAYYGNKPSGRAGLRFRTASENDLMMLIDCYHMISPEELEKVVNRKSVLLGYDQDRPVGFIGEHLEGSMGLLYVFPEYRNRGFGTELLTQLIAETMEKGRIPFGQVEKENQASLNLLKKAGMTLSENLIVWMWKQAGS